MSSKSKQSLKVDNNQKFPNNNTGFITPDKLRSFNEDIIDSFVANDYTQSVDNTIADVSQSFNQFTSSYYTDSASFDARIDAVDTSSYVTQTEFLNNSASVDTRFIGIEAETASLQSQIDNISVDTGSLVTTQSFNDYTQSTDSRLDSIETTTASLQSEINNITTGSLLETASANLNTITFTKADASTFNITIDTGSAGGTTDTGSLLETASVSLNTITFTKGDSTTFDITVDTGSQVDITSLNQFTQSADSRLNNIELATGSYATTGSNTFTQTQTLEQDLVVQGNLYVSGAEVIISSSELIVGDRIIEVNANKVIGDAGIYAFDAIGDQTGSLIWNPTLDYWLGGLSGSEEKILVSSDTASLETSVNTLNSYTQSTDLRLDSIESATGSYATTASNTFTGNQIIDNSAPRFQLGEVGNEKDTGFYDIFVNKSTSSSNSAGFRILTETPSKFSGIQYDYNSSFETSGSGKLYFNSVGVFGAPNGQVTLFETTHASQDFIVSGNLDVLTTFTAPLTQGNVWVGNSGGTNTQIPTSSFEADLTSLNSYTQSTDLRLDSIELTTQSFDGRLNNIESTTASFDGRLNNIELTTASFEGRLDSIELTTASFETRLDSIESETGSYATTGSNTFVGSQFVSGNLDLEETFTASLQQGYVWVGDSSGRTTTVATSSFAGGGGGGSITRLKIASPAQTMATGNGGTDNNMPSGWTTFTTLDITSGSAIYNVGGWTFDSASITCPEDGFYNFIGTFQVVQDKVSGTEGRNTPIISLFVNDVELKEEASAYTRQGDPGVDSPKYTIQLNTVVELSASDVLTVKTRQQFNADPYVTNRLLGDGFSKVSCHKLGEL